MLNQLKPTGYPFRFGPGAWMDTVLVNSCRPGRWFLKPSDEWWLFDFMSLSQSMNCAVMAGYRERQLNETMITVPGSTESANEKGV
jgi:hypothetical protein